VAFRIFKIHTLDNLFDKKNYAFPHTVLLSIFNLENISYTHKQVPRAHQLTNVTKNFRKKWTLTPNSITHICEVLY
jgi:hypothetical protein